MQLQTLKNILEALLLSADKPMDMRRLESLFEADEDRPSKDEIRQALQALQEDYQERGIQLKEVASGYRMQVVEDYASWVARLWEEKPPRYSRALLETLVLIAYRQPITRGEIEDIRGVSVSSHIIKTLLEREWVRVLGHKDVPGKPAMYGTTREFLDYFSLKSLDELPPLSEIKDLDKLHPELALDDSAEGDEAATGDADTDQGEGAEQAVDEAQPDSAADAQEEASEDAEAEENRDQATDEMAAEDADLEADEGADEQVTWKPTRAPMNRPQASRNPAQKARMKPPRRTPISSPTRPPRSASRPGPMRGSRTKTHAPMGLPKMTPTPSGRCRPAEPIASVTACVYQQHLNRRSG